MSDRCGAEKRIGRGMFDKGDPMFSDPLKAEVEMVLADLRRRGLKIVTAESCTGGLIAGVLTEIAGSSDVVDRGFVTYTNEAKVAMLGVPQQLIETLGAVSREVAEAMAAGALARSRATISVAVTGVAGPEGGSVAKPVGLVHIAAARVGGSVIHEECRFGAVSRSEIRERAVWSALALVRRLVATGDGKA